MYLARQIKKLLAAHPDINELAIYQKLEGFEKDGYYKNMSGRPVSTREHNYLKSECFNQDMVDITNGEVKLHNDRCVCCCETFLKNWEISNWNASFPVLIGLSEKESHEINLEKYICAVCNEGGGVIIIGVDRRGKSMVASGIAFKNSQSVEQKEK